MENCNSMADEIEKEPEESLPCGDDMVREERLWD
jgi:hypothetical protein